MTPRMLIVGIVLLLETVVVPPLSARQEHGEEHQPREAYISTADQTTVLRDDLIAIPGKEVHILHVELPAGWIGERHYHTGDVFVYVQEGEFVIDVDGEDRKTFGPGQVYHEAVNVVMQARNGSATVATKLVLFQVGDKGEPLMIKAD